METGTRQWALWLALSLLVLLIVAGLTFGAYSLGKNTRKSDDEVAKLVERARSQEQREGAEEKQAIQEASEAQLEEQRAQAEAEQEQAKAEGKQQAEEQFGEGAIGGYELGYEDGYDDGYSDGYDDGFAAAGF